MSESIDKDGRQGEEELQTAGGAAAGSGSGHAIEMVGQSALEAGRPEVGQEGEDALAATQGLLKAEQSGT